MMSASAASLCRLTKNVVMKIVVRKISTIARIEVWPRKYRAPRARAAAANKWAAHLKNFVSFSKYDGDGLGASEQPGGVAQEVAVPGGVTVGQARQVDVGHSVSSDEREQTVDPAEAVVVAPAVLAELADGLSYD